MVTEKFIIDGAYSVCMTSYNASQCNDYSADYAPKGYDPAPISALYGTGFSGDMILTALKAASSYVERTEIPAINYPYSAVQDLGVYGNISLTYDPIKEMQSSAAHSEVVYIGDFMEIKNPTAEQEKPAKASPASIDDIVLEAA